MFVCLHIAGKMCQLLVILTCLLPLVVSETTRESYISKPERPDVLVVILASNEEHLISTFFGGFERLSYPKKNIGNAIWLWCGKTVPPVGNSIIYEHFYFLFNTEHALNTFLESITLLTFMVNAYTPLCFYKIGYFACAFSSTGICYRVLIMLCFIFKVCGFAQIITEMIPRICLMFG